MSFNPDLNKQAQEVVFSRKLNKASHPKIFFNNALVVHASWQKHLRMFLDENLNFSYHIKEKSSKAMKGIGIFKKISKTSPQHALITIYKSFVRPHLDYGDIIYDQPNKENLNQKIERIQYNAALAITGAIKGTSQAKLYNELGFESLNLDVGFRNYVLFIKSKQLEYQSTCLILFLKPIIYTIHVHHIMLQHFAAELMYISILSFHIQY